MDKPLSSLQEQAIRLLLSGKSEGEVATTLCRSRSWVQSLKRRDDYKQVCERLQVQDIKFQKQIAKRQLDSQRKIIDQSLESWLDRQEKLRQQEWLISQKFIEKAIQMLEYSLEEKSRWSFADTARIFEIVSKISRQTTELWSADLNSALQIVLKHGYTIIDNQLVEGVSDSQSDDTF